MKEIWCKGCGRFWGWADEEDRLRFWGSEIWVEMAVFVCPGCGETVHWRWSSGRLRRLLEKVEGEIEG